MVLTVSDTGRGIPAEELPHIFESRFRASNNDDQRDNDYGLSIVKRIVNHHQGTITCKSMLDQGSVFMVSLLHRNQTGSSLP